MVYYFEIDFWYGNMTKFHRNHWLSFYVEKLHLSDPFELLNAWYCRI